MALSLLLLCAVSVPAAAETDPAEGADNGGDERLAAVTAKVKETLGLNTEGYSEFNGSLVDGELAPAWSLNWSGDAGSMEVEATESGQVIRFYRFDADDQRDTGRLTLPKGDPAKAKAAAEAFLKRVLAENESVRLESSGYNSLRQTNYYYRGSILLNGLDSPVDYSVTVRASDNAVTRFYRDNLETEYMGGVPSAGSKTPASTAKALLRDTLSLRLEYVLNEDGSAAALRYLPNTVDSYYVDDGSGKLVNLTELYKEISGDRNYFGAEDGPTAEAAMDTGGNGAPQLTEAEQLGADKLKDMLPKETLEQKARAITELGLGKYTLSSASYRDEGEDQPFITARLVFVKSTDDGSYRRTVTLDAKTGELQSVYSSMPWIEDFTPQVDKEQAEKTAGNFLAAYRAERFGECKPYEGDPVSALRYDGDERQYNISYARSVNGWPFPACALNVEIDSTDGSICGFTETWPEGVSFDSAGGIISMDQAVDAYLDAFQVRCSYVAVPQALSASDPIYAPMLDMGYTYLNALKLGYQLKFDSGKSPMGIDAKSGAPVYGSYSESSFTYGDLDGAGEAKPAIEMLASYNIGFAGGSFFPSRELSQLDLVVLLASTDGLRLNPDDLQSRDADMAYQSAYAMGVLSKAERDDSKALSRLDVLRMLLDAGGYGPVAKLQNIYRTDFADQPDIPNGLLGYAALAQAMGVVNTGSEGMLYPNRTATRADAAIMLLAFMQR